MSSLAQREAADQRRMGDVLLAVEDISLRFGGIRALTEVSFDIRKGEIRAIIGPNGAGKSSMLNVLNGFYRPQSGMITWKGQHLRRMQPYLAASTGIARTFQNIALFKGMTALDNIMSGRTLKMRRGFFWQLIRYGPASPRRSSTADGSRRSSTSCRSSTSAGHPSASCPTACRSGSSSPGRSPPSPTSCCSTSRWPA